MIYNARNERSKYTPHNEQVITGHRSHQMKFTVSGLLMTCLALAAVKADQEYHERWQAARKSGVCHLHQTDMTKITVPIMYGMPVRSEYSEKLRQAEKDSFPHAKDAIPGGCVPREETESIVYECPACRAAKEKWIKEHPGPADTDR